MRPPASPLGRKESRTPQRISQHVEKRTTLPLREELPALLKQRGKSLRSLAADVGVNQSYLSRILREGGSGARRPTAAIAIRIAEALGLPADYFAEARAGFVVERVLADGALRDRVYDRLRRES